MNNTNIWDDDIPVDITSEANFIWGIANKLRGSYMPDKYGDVIIPMTIIRRFECALENTKEKVVAQFEANPNYPAKAMYRISGYQFYNTSEYNLAELCNDSEHITANFESYIEGFSSNVQNILKELDMNNHIKKMNTDGCLFNVIKAFSELDLSVEKFDSIKMGYIFENLMSRFFENVDAGQFYTGRDIIKTCISLLTAEGCDDLFEDGKVITVCDQAAGSGGMLTTFDAYMKHMNPTANMQLFGQEIMGPTHAIGLAEMLIKGQNAENFRRADTLKEDCFPDVKMRFVLENPPFGTPWSGKDAKAGQETAVKEEYAKGKRGRWGAGLPGGGDSQLIFMQSAVAKMDDKVGRAAIIENGSPLFTGGVSSGESQTRRWLLENDLIEAIIALPIDLFYNTGIATYIWLLSKNKKEIRKGKIQLIDATSICHKLRKPLGNKKNEFTSEDRAKITELYTNFEQNDLCQIYDNTEFIYREYTVMQPLQRSYAITEERIQNMIQKGTLNGIYDETFVQECEQKAPSELTSKESVKLLKMKTYKHYYYDILEVLNKNKTDIKYFSKDEFKKLITPLLEQLVDNQYIEKIIDSLSIMDKDAKLQKDKNGNIIYDKETKDTEIVKINDTIDDYMAREVLPFVPDAKAFFDEDLSKKKPIIKTGAEIPFTRYFYKYEEPDNSEDLVKQFLEIDTSVNKNIHELFK